MCDQAWAAVTNEFTINGALDQSVRQMQSLIRFHVTQSMSPLVPRSTSDEMVVPPVDAAVPLTELNDFRESVSNGVTVQWLSAYTASFDKRLEHEKEVRGTAEENRRAAEENRKAAEENRKASEENRMTAFQRLEEKRLEIELFKLRQVAPRENDRVDDSPPPKRARRGGPSSSAASMSVSPVDDDDEVARIDRTLLAHDRPYGNKLSLSHAVWRAYVAQRGGGADYVPEPPGEVRGVFAEAARVFGTDDAVQQRFKKQGVQAVVRPSTGTTIVLYAPPVPRGTGPSAVAWMLSKMFPSTAMVVANTAASHNEPDAVGDDPSSTTHGGRPVVPSSTEDADAESTTMTPRGVSPLVADFFAAATLSNNHPRRNSVVGNNTISGSPPPSPPELALLRWDTDVAEAFAKCLPPNCRCGIPWSDWAPSSVSQKLLGVERPVAAARRLSDAVQRNGGRKYLTIHELTHKVLEAGTTPETNRLIACLLGPNVDRPRRISERGPFEYATAVAPRIRALGALLAAADARVTSAL